MTRSLSDLLSALLLAALIAVLGPGHGHAQDRPVLRLATQFLPPYQILVNDQMTGIAVERVKCALDRMNRPYELHMISWPVAQTATENGEFEGFFAASRNSARALYATPSVPVISEDLAWYMQMGTDIDPNNPADRLKARYSAKFATSKWLNLKRNGYNVVKKPQDAASLLNMLLVGDIDVALEYELIFEHFMAEREIARDHFKKIPYLRQDLSVHFSNTFLQANPLFLSRFNDELTRCVKETS